MGGPRDFNFITPEEAAELMAHDGVKDVEYYKHLANNKGICECGEPVWKLGDNGMCFSCTTGEADASDDYELSND